MAERLESLKAAMLASFGAILAFAIINQINKLVLIKFPVFNANQITIYNSIFDFHWWLSAGIILFSGFLFGVTYRYIIRKDNNFQLKVGGVMAFGMVRGLVQIEMKVAMVNDINNLLKDAFPLVVLLAENIFVFALAALVLDVAINAGWIKAFD
jgi:hypothetical protein